MPKPKEIEVFKVVKARCGRLTSVWSPRPIEYHVGEFVKDPGSYLFSFLTVESATHYADVMQHGDRFTTLSVYRATMRWPIGLAWIQFYINPESCVKLFKKVKKEGRAEYPLYPSNATSEHLAVSMVGRMIRLNTLVYEA